MKNLQEPPRCEICLKQIAVKRDSYYIKSTINHGKLITERYWHKNCVDDQDRARMQTQRSMNELMNYLPGALESMGIKKEEVFEIPIGVG